MTVLCPSMRASLPYSPTVTRPGKLKNSATRTMKNPVELSTVAYIGPNDGSALGVDSTKLQLDSEEEYIV